MSKLEVNKIDPQSGTDLELGTSGDTITIPAGVTFDSSAATNTLPSTVVTTTGTQTLTNKSIVATQLTGTITPSDNTVSLAKLTATGTKDATTFLRGDNTFASAGGGKVLQVVNATDSTERTTTSTSFVTASNTLSVSITPSLSSSKILVFANCGGVYVNASAQYIYLTIFRDATNIGDATYGLTEIRSYSTGDLGYPTSIQVYDSPSTTSSLTYQVYLRTTTSTANLNTSGALASITAMEIGA